MMIRRAGLAVIFCCVIVAVAWGAESPNVGLIYTTEKQAELAKGGKDPLATYRNALEMQHAAVVALGQNEPEADIDARLALLDGVLLPGGIDVCPERYGAMRHPKLEDTDPDLERIETRVLNFARDHHIPVLGICRGEQMMNVYGGGTLIQDIPSDVNAAVKVIHRQKDTAYHAIRIEPNTRLHALIGGEPVTVNSLHHQAVKDLAPGWIISARTEDGVVEAIEYPGERFVLGVQFHPEKILENEPRLKDIFAGFVDAARKVHETRIAIPSK